MSKIHRTDVQLRFGDTDALGHINNVSFAAYSELARLEFIRAVGHSLHSMILASLHIDFRRQLTLDDAVHVESWISRLGNSSLAIDQRIFANEQRAADIKSVVVYFDYKANRPQALTDEMRRVLQPYVVEA